MSLSHQWLNYKIINATQIILKALLSYHTSLGDRSTFIIKETACTLGLRLISSITTLKLYNYYCVYSISFLIITVYFIISV